MVLLRRCIVCIATFTMTEKTYLASFSSLSFGGCRVVGLPVIHVSVTPTIVVFRVLLYQTTQQCGSITHFDPLSLSLFLFCAFLDLEVGVVLNGPAGQSPYPYGSLSTQRNKVESK